MSQISKEIFDKIRTRFSNVTIGDQDGNVTLDSDKGAFFEFDYKDRGNIVLNLQDDSIKNKTKLKIKNSLTNNNLKNYEINEIKKELKKSFNNDIHYLQNLNIN